MVKSKLSSFKCSLDWRSNKLLTRLKLHVSYISFLVGHNCFGRSTIPANNGGIKLLAVLPGFIHTGHLVNGH